MSLRARAADAFARLPPSVRYPVLHRLGRYAPWEPGFDFTPPPLRPGEVTGPPDFVGIGVQKAGTTWWHGLIAEHPGVMSRGDLHKERHFFDRFGSQPFTDADVADYHGWFPRRPGTLAGEWTPDYFSSPWVPPLLQRAAPGARLLLLVRDPVDRFQSGLAHQRRMGGGSGADATADAFQRGFYHRALVDWLTQVDRSQLLVLQYERCAADPVRQLQATFAFLGLPEFRPPGLTDSGGRPPGGRSGLDPELRGRLVAAYESDVTALAAAVPDLDLGLWPNFAYLAGGDASGGGANSPTRRP